MTIPEPIGRERRAERLDIPLSLIKTCSLGDELALIEQLNVHSALTCWKQQRVLAACFELLQAWNQLGRNRHLPLAAMLRSPNFFSIAILNALLPDDDFSPGKVDVSPLQVREFFVAEPAFVVELEKNKLTLITRCKEFLQVFRRIDLNLRFPVQHRLELSSFHETRTMRQFHHGLVEFVDPNHLPYCCQLVVAFPDQMVLPLEQLSTGDFIDVVGRGPTLKFTEGMTMLFHRLSVVAHIVEVAINASREAEPSVDGHFHLDSLGMLKLPSLGFGGGNSVLQIEMQDQRLHALYLLPALAWTPIVIQSLIPPDVEIAVAIML